MNNLGQISSQ